MLCEVAPVLQWYSKPAGRTSGTDSPGQAADGPEISPPGFASTWTWNVQRPSLPHASRATTVTTLWHTGRWRPEAAVALDGDVPRFLPRPDRRVFGAAPDRGRVVRHVDDLRGRAGVAARIRR